MSGPGPFPRKYWWLVLVFVPILVAAIGILPRFLDLDSSSTRGHVIHIDGPALNGDIQIVGSQQVLSEIQEVIQNPKVLEMLERKVDGTFDLLRSDLMNEALREFEGIARRAETSSLYNNVGALRLLAGDPDGASVALERGVALAPSSATLRQNLALLYESRGQLADAIVQLESLEPSQEVEAKLKQLRAELSRLPTLPPASSAASHATVLSFDGVNDHVETRPTNALKSLPLTLEAWVKPRLRGDGTADFPNNVISNDQPTLAGHGFGVTVLRSEQILTVQYSAGFARIPYPFKDNHWYHIAIVYMPGIFRAYVDGEFVRELHFDQKPLRGVGFIRIGKHNDDVSRYRTRRFFKGDIDDVRVWRIARSGGDLRLNMQRQLDGTEPGLVHYWRLDEGSGITAADQTGNGSTALLGSGGPSEAPKWTTFDMADQSG